MLDGTYLSILVDEENPLCRVQTKMVSAKKIKKSESNQLQNDK
jgi:hypothetical protein